MKNKALMGLIATATIGTAIATPAIMNNQNTTHIVNKVLMVSNEKTNEAVVINGNSKMNLYALANGSGIVSNLSTGEMLTILGQVQNGYCKVRVQETGAVGYINVANMQNILNGNNDSFTQLSGNGQVINVSSNVRLRSNPAIGNNIIGHLTNGTILNILGKQGQWYKVIVNGQTGFIYEEYVSTNIASNSQSLTNNINTNSGNTSTSATSTSSSSSTSNTNLSNHVKNIVVRTKSSATSNVNEVNNSQSKIINKTKSSSSSQVNKNSNIGISSQKNNTANSKKNVNQVKNNSKKIEEYKNELINNKKQLKIYENQLKQEENNLKTIPIKSVQNQKKLIKSLNETLKNMQYGINKTKQGIEGFKKQIILYNEALVHDNVQLNKVKSILKKQENSLKNTSGKNKQTQINEINKTKNLIKNMESGIIKTKQAIAYNQEKIKKYNEALVHDNNIFLNEQMKLIQAENGLNSTYERAKNNEIEHINKTKNLIKNIINNNNKIEKELNNLQ